MPQVHHDSKSHSLRSPRSAAGDLTTNARRCRRKFLKTFPRGFKDDTYFEWSVAIN